MGALGRGSRVKGRQKRYRADIKPISILSLRAIGYKNSYGVHMSAINLGGTHFLSYLFARKGFRETKQSMRSPLKNIQLKFGILTGTLGVDPCQDASGKRRFIL